MTLTEFLLARIAEDEKAAKEAFTDEHRWLVEDESISLWPDDDDRLIGHMLFPLKVHAHHAATWEPARVLAECEAKRRIVNEHQAERPDLERFEPQSCRICYYDDRDLEIVPCPTLRLLALPYADHPDYQQEWAL